MAPPDAEVLFKQIVDILAPYVPDEDALSQISKESTLLGDLRINSARLIDIVLDFEGSFDMAISDEQLAELKTVGDAVSIVQRRDAS